MSYYDVQLQHDGQPLVTIGKGLEQADIDGLIERLEWGLFDGRKYVCESSWHWVSRRSDESVRATVIVIRHE